MRPILLAAALMSSCVYGRPFNIADLTALNFPPIFRPVAQPTPLAPSSQTQAWIKLDESLFGSMDQQTMNGYLDDMSAEYQQLFAKSGLAQDRIDALTNEVTWLFQAMKGFSPTSQFEGALTSLPTVEEMETIAKQCGDYSCGYSETSTGNSGLQFGGDTPGTLAPRQGPGCVPVAARVIGGIFTFGFSEIIVLSGRTC
jgi:hypothetical protein